MPGAAAYLCPEYKDALLAQEALGIISTALVGQDLMFAGSNPTPDMGLEASTLLPFLNFLISKEAAIAYGVQSALELSNSERQGLKEQAIPDFMELARQGKAALQEHYGSQDQHFVLTYAALSLAPKLAVLNTLLSTADKQSAFANFLEDMFHMLPDYCLRPEYREAGLNLAVQIRHYGPNAPLLEQATAFVEGIFNENLLHGSDLVEQFPFLANVEAASEYIAEVQQAVTSGTLADLAEKYSGFVAPDLLLQTDEFLREDPDCFVDGPRKIVAAIEEIRGADTSISETAGAAVEQSRPGRL